jgi:hypothetical protein
MDKVGKPSNSEYLDFKTFSWPINNNLWLKMALGQGAKVFIFGFSYINYGIKIEKKESCGTILNKMVQY